MNELNSHYFWQKIVDKIEAKESLDAGTLVWDYVTRVGTLRKKDFVGREEAIRLQREDYIKKSLMSDAELHIEYEKFRSVLEENIQQTQEMKLSLEKEFKSVLKQIRESKINTDLKKGIGEVLNSYLERLNTELKEYHRHLIGFEEWKKDFLNICQTQIPYLDARQKEAKASDVKNQKMLDILDSCFPRQENTTWNT